MRERGNCSVGQRSQTHRLKPVLLEAALPGVGLEMIAGSMLSKMITWVSVHLRSRYVLLLEEEVERLRGENRALVNSLLGTAGFPPISLDDDARRGGVGMTAVRRRTWTQIAREREMAAGKGAGRNSPILIVEVTQRGSMRNKNSNSQGESMLDRAIDRIEPQPPAPKSPAPPPVDQTQWEQSVNGHKVNKLTVRDVGLIVFNEMQSYKDTDSANESISSARQKVAHAIINADTKFGAKRQPTRSECASD